MIIDFSNRDNLIFLVILLAIAIIIVFIFVVLISEIIRIIRKIIAGIVRISTKDEKFNQRDEGADLNVAVEELDKSKEERVAIEQQEPAMAEDPAPKLDNSMHIDNGEAKILAPVRPMVGDVKSVKVILNQGSYEAIVQKAKENVGMNSPGSGFGYDTIVQKAKENTTPDSFMFKGGSEVSKIRLEHKMRNDSDIWKAAKASGLTMSSVERAKLVKEVFTPAQGRNISKADLKQSVRKLNRKMLGTTDSAEHAKLRKEIKFFKKIGGIK